MSLGPSHLRVTGSMNAHWRKLNVMAQNIVMANVVKNVMVEKNIMLMAVRVLNAPAMMGLPSEDMAS